MDNVGKGKGRAPPQSITGKWAARKAPCGDSYLLKAWCFGGGGGGGFAGKRERSSPPLKTKTETGKKGRTGCPQSTKKGEEGP